MTLLRAIFSLRRALALGGWATGLALIFVSTRFGVPVNEFFIALAASVVIGTTTPLILRLQRRILRRELAGFFGDELIWKNLVLVYPEFVVHQEVMNSLERDNKKLMYDKPPASGYTDMYPRHIDVERVVASNDIEALLEVVTVFKNLDENISTLTTDGSAFKECDMSFISFGLTSNDCTFMYLEKHREERLFDLVDLASDGVALRMRDGRQFKNTAEDDFSVIVRYAPEPTIPGRRWFLVAGLGPRGTPAAGIYLAKHWRDLRRQVRDDKNFCAVIQTSAANIKMERDAIVYSS